MSHKLIVYGVIIGPYFKEGSDNNKLQILNKKIIHRLPRDEDWPAVDKSMFSVPGGSPYGMFKSQVIHFGSSMKDDPENYKEGSFYYMKMRNEWMNKFEKVLRQLYWNCVRLHIESDFHERIEFTYVPTDSATAAMMNEFPLPIQEWIRTEQVLPGKKLLGT